eukprot:31314-Pelagococcus_subviridis.AAC.39
MSRSQRAPFSRRDAYCIDYSFVDAFASRRRSAQSSSPSLSSPSLSDNSPSIASIIPPRQTGFGAAAASTFALFLSASAAAAIPSASDRFNPAPNAALSMSNLFFVSSLLSPRSFAARAAAAAAFAALVSAARDKVPPSAAAHVVTPHVVTITLRIGSHWSSTSISDSVLK